MEVIFHDVGLCSGCERIKGKPACFSVVWNRIGRECAVCKHATEPHTCQTCIRDVRLLHRRDLYGDTDASATCGQCQRDVRILERTDRFEKGLPTIAKKQLDEVNREIGMRSPMESANEWLRGG
jgi:glutaredoxin